MDRREFVLQGFTTRTHGEAVRELFNIDDIERVLVSVAFVSESGVIQIEEQLRAYAAQSTFFVGIRNDITSYQGLKRLFSIVGSALYTVDTGSRGIIFHPKLYLVRGQSIAKLCIGSANLTLGGLNNNIEAGMTMGFDINNGPDKTLIDEIELSFHNLPHQYPEHVTKILNIGQLDALLASGRVIDEMAELPPRPSTSAGATGGTTDTVPRIKLKVIPLRRALAKARVVATKPPAPTPTGKAAFATPKPVIPAVGVQIELVWESKPLTRRDLTIPTEAGTNQTGSVNLDKGLLPDSVDHRPYFRSTVFASLKWGKRSATVDEAFAKFQLVLKGISYGEFDLAIRHTNSTTSAAYHQHNAMTRLSWGPMRDFIARPDLIGRTLSLYRDKVDPARFVLEID